MHLIIRVIDADRLNCHFMSSDKAIQRHVPLLATVRINHTRCFIKTLFAFSREGALSDSFWLFVEVEHFRVFA